MSKDIELEPHEVQEIINWAIGTGSILSILHDTVYDEDDADEDIIERLHGAVELMYHNIPDSILESCTDQAERIVESVDDDDEEETLVQQFRQELEGL